MNYIVKRIDAAGVRDIAAFEEAMHAIRWAENYIEDFMNTDILLSVHVIDIKTKALIAELDN